MQRQRAEVRRLHHIQKLGRRNSRNVDRAGLELEPLQIVASADFLDYRVQVGNALDEVVRILHQHQSLAADPLGELERAAADHVAGEILAPSLDHLVRHCRRKRHRELLHEDRIGPVQTKNDRPWIGRRDTADLACMTRLKFRRARYLAKIFHPLRARRRIEHALDFVLEVGGGYRPAVGEAGVAAQVKREDPRVGRLVPPRRDLGHQVDAAVAVTHQRVENHLLEGPRGGVIAGGRVERRHVVLHGEMEHLRAGRKARRRRRSRPAAASGAA